MNPFRDNIVASPWESTRADVPEIHGPVFDQCLRAIEDVRSNRRSTALLIHGEAGSGKTHLLGRLRRTLALQAPSDTERDECLYVWVRLQTSPRMIWRTLRRTLVEDWFRPVAGERTQFERILFHRLAEIRVASGDLDRWYEYMLDEHPEGLDELMERIATSLHLDRNTAIAFKHIAFGRHLRDLRAWLAGTPLPQAALERMDLVQDDGTDEEREDEARQVVLMLCRLAGNGLPIVLSFDQVEALQMAPGDTDALFAFGQLISTLHDHGTDNLILISCVQSAFATEFKDHARDADYDRMTSFGAFSLDPLDPNQAAQLIARRREAAGISQSGPWPLKQGEFEALFENAGFVTPRKLLGLCAERFESHGEPIEPHGVERFLEETWNACIARKLADSGPERTEDIVRHGLPMLVRLVAPEAKLVKDAQLPDVSLIFEKEAARMGLSLGTQSNMTSLAGQLKRLKGQFAKKRLQRLVIVRDPRVPISPGAKVARQSLSDLEQQGAQIVFPTVEALAALDALRALLSDAKSGDLAWDGNTVSPQTVEEWLTAHLARELQDFVDEIFVLQNSDTRDVEALHELLAQHPILRLDEAARALDRPIEEVTATARKYPNHFRVLGEPPETLFRTTHSPAVDTGNVTDPNRTEH